MTRPPRGRRPGNPDTREGILAAARGSFAEHGYAGTTIRAVARASGVDAALVHHYFGSKADLFMASLQLPVDPRAVLLSVADEGIDGAGERLLRTFLSIWDDPAIQPGLLAVVRGVMDPATTGLVADGFLPVVVVPLGEALGIDDPERRMPIVASQVIGLILTRYVRRVDPMASMDADEMVAVFAPTLQRYLVDEL